MDGVKHPADLIVEEPFNWGEIMGLMCPI
jgi:hypothetical protein